MGSMPIQVNKISMKKYGVWFYKLTQEQKDDVISIYYDYY